MLLLDVVLGYGADPDPAGSLVPALTAARAARPLPVVVALIGTEADPQGWSRQADALAAAGAAVFASNAAAVRYALDLLGGCPMSLLAACCRPSVVAAGVDVFSDALRAQGAEVHDVDWRPPGFGDPADLAALALDPRRAAANRTAVERVLAAGSRAGRRPPGPRGARAGRPHAAARRAADRLGARLGPDARRADRRLPVRGLGRRPPRTPSGCSPPARSPSTRATTTARSGRWPG